MTSTETVAATRNAMPFDSSVIAPVRSLLAAPENNVLAIISRIEGPSYRPLGAMMAVSSERDWVGSLSSGCIEADIALHACAARDAGAPSRVLYGNGSPFVDIQLPCGGGLEILLLPKPDLVVLQDVLQMHDGRQPCTLDVDVENGLLSLGDARRTVRTDNLLHIRIEPEVLFQVFGKGPEASTFASLVQAAGFPNLLLTSDRETLDAARAAGCQTRHLKSSHFPADLSTDARTAVTLFFHDHHLEAPILARVLETPALYVGAQGSRKAAEQRLAELEALGCSRETLNRLRGPIGLVPSARDPRTLAVSVLAEILAIAMRHPS
ncbi:MAG: XdhC family protein [Woeseiaceae bacterium]|nr:XdhC family protein [Woeseiaceae bacterium]